MQVFKIDCLSLKLLIKGKYLYFSLIFSWNWVYKIYNNTHKHKWNKNHVHPYPLAWGHCLTSVVSLSEAQVEQWDCSRDVNTKFSQGYTLILKWPCSTMSPWHRFSSMTEHLSLKTQMWFCFFVSHNTVMHSINCWFCDGQLIN